MNQTNFTSLPEEPSNDSAMITRFTFVACFFSAILVACNCDHADENIVSVSKLGLDKNCSDICRKETPSCTWEDGSSVSEEEDKISETCMNDATECYLNCTNTEADENHAVSNIKVSELSMDATCVNECRPETPDCTRTGDYISQKCLDHPKMLDCYSTCTGAVEPQDLI
ncbi:hypothetical protein CAPTEDRAFT_206633 [Capitella teleta]|uniref:Uncharacterized protein n=1 Tax=Capitella teleta TaxID=283909 RepID=R7TZT3_CAPTE|nr:hypothetical protein CAPTEDRAFT_192687 [Capitella teleta]ELU07839.1 hypothetical protein CAPTEDRAFT_206633 [Capitella teleta]|eukprot:ELT96445.1 hypothetical protein CAPTEDRAFT_192687 [Capitella teleta]